MRACPARKGKGACACSTDRFPTSGFGRRPERTYGRHEVEPKVAPQGGGVNDSIDLNPSAQPRPGAMLRVHHTAATLAFRRPAQREE